MRLGWDLNVIHLPSHSFGFWSQHKVITSTGGGWFLSFSCFGHWVVCGLEAQRGTVVTLT
jgi:hypothetical protein